MAYVKFNSNNRSEFHSMTSFDGGEEISNELHGKDLIKEGDTIIYTKFTANEVKHDGQEYFVVAERDIIAVVDNTIPNPN